MDVYLWTMWCIFEIYIVIYLRIVVIDWVPARAGQAVRRTLWFALGGGGVVTLWTGGCLTKWSQTSIAFLPWTAIFFWLSCTARAKQNNIGSVWIAQICQIIFRLHHKHIFQLIFLYDNHPRISATCFNYFFISHTSHHKKYYNNYFK